MTDHRPEFPNETRVFQGGFEPGDLVFNAGDSLWIRIEELCEKGGPGEHLDAAMAGKAAPRTWLIVHPPGHGELSTAVALVFARELASRDQSALVLDADETDAALTGWIERDEAEGWIDLARYGTSVLTSGVNLPFAGRRGYVLGVGSFTPTDVTDEEISALMARLRRQADDVLVVAPAEVAGAAWAGAADARILCWDPETTSRSEAGEMAMIFEQAGHPLTGVIALGDLPASGLVASEERLVEDVLAESAEPEEDFTGHEGFDDGPVTDLSEPSTDDSDPRVGSPSEPESAPESAPESGPDEDEWNAPPLGPGSYGEGVEPKRGTSMVFWLGAVAAVLVIAIAVVYYFKVLKVPAEGHFENLPVATRTQPVPAGSPAEATTGQDADPALAAGLADSMAAVDETPAVTDTLPPVVEDPSSGMNADAGGEQAGTVESEPSVVPAESSPAPADVFDMAPYLVPVGEQGWALHVYSLPNMESLQVELKELDRRGFKTAVKAVDVPDKGRWYRVFLGNFATRGEADAAKSALLENLGADYAAAKRFESSSPESSPDQ